MSTSEALITGAGPATTRLLLVDDEPVVLWGLRDLLIREGYPVDHEQNPVAALELVRRQQYALVLTDQRMPQMSGLELLAEVKGIQPETTRVLMTGVLDLTMMVEAINAGEIFRFIVKPWLREELLVTVKNSVQRYEMLCRNVSLQHGMARLETELRELKETLRNETSRVADQDRRLAACSQALDGQMVNALQYSFKTLETFHPLLAVQARRTVELCASMMSTPDWLPEQRRLLEMAAWLHDVGMLGVSRRLIRAGQENPASLNEFEQVWFKRHAVLGQTLAQSVDPTPELGELIRSHHERYDGHGYPDGLAGTEIPWLARVLAVAAHVAESPLGESEIYKQLQRASGTAFDPEAVNLLMQTNPIAQTSRSERVVSLADLQPGMVLAKGIYTPDGMLLMPEGQPLNVPNIEKLRCLNRLSPMRQSLWVCC